MNGHPQLPETSDARPAIDRPGGEAGAGGDVDQALDLLLRIADDVRDGAVAAEGDVQMSRAIRTMHQALASVSTQAIATADRLRAQTAMIDELREDLQNLRAQVVAFRRLVIEQRNELQRAIDEAVELAPSLH